MKPKIDYPALLAAALAAANKAYAPYSKFRVGAAALLDDGTLVTGSNQENAAYPLGSCAERVAVNYARSTYPERKILALAVASPDAPGRPVTPCGGCRQLLIEAVQAQGADITVIMSGLQLTATELLPHAFSK